MKENEQSAEASEGKKPRRRFRAVIGLLLLLFLGVVAFQAAKLISVTKRKEAEERTALLIDEGRRHDVVKNLDLGESSLDAGNLDDAEAALKKSKILDLEGTHSARFDELRRRYQSMKQAALEAEKVKVEKIAKFDSDLSILDRDLDSANLVEKLVETEKRVEDSKEMAKELDLAGSEQLILVSAKFVKRARAITNARYRSLMGQISSAIISDGVTVKNAAKLLEVIRAEGDSRFLDIDLHAQGKELEGMLSKHLVLLEKQTKFRTMLNESQWDDARRFIAEMERSGADRVKLEQEIADSVQVAEARKERVRDLISQASKMDDGYYNPEALILLDEALRLDSKNVDAEAMRLKLVGYGGILRVPGDFASLDEAVAAAKEGDKLMLGIGTFYCSSKIGKAVVIEGQGVGVTILETSGEDGAALYVANKTGRASISKITIRAKELIQGDERYPLVLVEGDCLMEDIEVEGASGHGIALVNGRLDLKRCKVSKSGWDGITVKGANSHVVLTDCLISQNGEHGVDFWDGGVGTVFRTKIQASGKTGIVVSGAESRVTVADVVVEGSRDSGLSISGGSLVHMDRLVVRLSQFSGIVIQDAKTRVKFSAVTVTSNGQAGVLVGPACSVSGVDQVSGDGNLDGLILKKKLPTKK